MHHARRLNLLRGHLMASWRLLAAVAVGICCLTRSLDAADPAPGGAIAGQPADALVLADVLWQVVPEDLRGAIVGPDDRIWLELPTAQPVTVAMAKETIAREFSRPTPRLPGLRPVLFEPEGRVWFGGPLLTFILGFDGRDWVERQLDKARFLVFESPPRFPEPRQTPNVAAAGRAFFPATNGVHVYDGREWSHLPSQHSESNKQPIWLLRQADGAGVLMNREPETWVWRDGSWSRVRSDLKQPATACPAPDGRVWMFGDNGRVVAVPVQGGGTVAKDAGAVIARLREARTAADRQPLVEELAASGAKAAIEEALASSLDPDFLAALASALKMIEKPTVSLLGDYSVTSASLFAFDNETGTVVLTVRGARRAQMPLGDGLLVAHPRDPWRFFAAPEVTGAGGELRGFLFADRGRGLWIDLLAIDTPPFRVDLETGAVTARLPDPRFGWPLAERRDGTVLVGRCQVREQGNIGPVVGGIAAFRPGRPDDHVVLPTESWPLKPGFGGFLGVDSTGAVWANLADIGLSRFLDGSWRVLPGSGVMGADQIDGVIFGGRGDAIIRCRQWCYWNGSTMTSYPGLEPLVKANRETIAASFGPVLRPRRMAFFGVASDGAGRIWAYDERVPKCSVLVGDDWLDARDVMRAGGLPEGRAGGVVAAGGNAVYISDFYQVHRGGRSFFCTFADGKPVFRDAPHTVDSSEVLTGPRDRADGLWIAANVRTKGGPADAPTDVIGDQLAIRIVGGTVATTLRNAGWPVLCDADGAVWLDEVPDRPHGTFNVWRSGTTTGTVHVPGLMDGLLGGDRPGMVYARTARGVTHLVPDGATYRIGSRYAVAGVDGVFTPLAVVSDGLLVGSGFGKTIGPPPFRGAGTVPQFRLVMARLPRPDTQPAPGKP